MTVLHWLGTGLREALVMVWMTWWPLVLGFTLSGLVQSFVPRDGLRQRLGTTSPGSVTVAAALGVVSSSCSYAASATARALFARGASFTNAIVFMVASTNLVIELGIVLYLLLGWQFLAAQFVGGVIMVALLGLVIGRAFSPTREESLRQKVLADTPATVARPSQSWRARLRDRSRYVAAARYTVGDVTMLRKELLAGFVVAGFLAVHVPSSAWSHLFWTGHGAWTVAENVVVAPLLAVISFVCSVGNIPLAAALWMHGVAFGGVIAFIFADLVTLPLLAIYRRFYGTAATVRLFVVLWLVMAVGGALVNALFAGVHGLPAVHATAMSTSHFDGGVTFVLNVLAAVGLVAWWWLSRRPTTDDSVATDPICGMTVDTSSPAATRVRDGVTTYFCSLRCAERFDAGEAPAPMDAMSEDPEGDAVDPVCSMTVNSSTALSGEKDGTRYYFCSAGCRTTFLEGPVPTAIHLGRKPS